MSSNLQPDTVVLYLDQNLGTQIIPRLLTEHEIPFEIHDSHLASDAPDEDWINLCSDRKWIALTRDLRLKYNAPARAAIKSSTIGIFAINVKNVTNVEIGELIVSSYEKICKYCEKTKRPFLARLTRAGHINPDKVT